jgi:hypothetical protein
VSTTPSPLERFLAVLERTGGSATAEEAAEILWLATRVSARGRAATRRPEPSPTRPPPLLHEQPARESLPPVRGETFGPSTVTTTSVRQERGPAGDLYPAQAERNRDGVPARRILSPGAVALPGALELGRSLRPLKRRVPSRAQVVLDEDATAQRIAETADWTPVFHAAPERWLDITLLVDESPSMLIWQQTVVELQRLAERQGAFRRIETLGFAPSQAPAGIDVYSGVGPRADRTRRRAPAELSNAFARRLIAVVSDCVSPIWRTGSMSALLARWGRAGKVLIVQVLPDRLWPRTGLRTFQEVFVRSPSPDAPNAEFEIDWAGYRPTDAELRGTAIPVVSLDPNELSYWSRAVAGNSSLWIPAVFANAPPRSATRTSVTTTGTPPSAAAESQPRATTPPAEQIVRVFYGTASPTARRLASLLAAAPLTLPVMRLVQRVMLPESRQSHLAEVWLSGLIDRPAEIDRTKPADETEYFFVNGVRELLVNNLRVGEALSVLAMASNYIGDRVGQPLDFPALVADANATGDVHIAAGYQAFARVAANILRRFGGQYINVARRLEVSVYGETLEPVTIPAEVSVDQTVDAGSMPSAEPPTGRVRALLVGTDKHASPIMTPLAGTGNDVEVTRQWLQKRLGVAAGDITILRDESATRAAVVAAWEQTISQMSSGDQFFFHFSGNDQPISGRHPREPYDMEESLFMYDSDPTVPLTVLTHSDLAALIARLEQKGARATVVLDTCHAGSGVFARSAMRNSVIFAACAETEYAREGWFDGKMHGAVTWFIAQAMEQPNAPDLTWLDVRDYVVAQLRIAGYDQNPQIFGPSDVIVLRSEHRPVQPYSVVTKTSAREIEIDAPLALGLADRKPFLAIYPPGSSTRPPIATARITRTTPNGYAASLAAAIDVRPGSRARVFEAGDAKPVLRAALERTVPFIASISPRVALSVAGRKKTDVTVSIRDRHYVMTDWADHEVWRAPVSPDADPSIQVAEIKTVLERLATYLSVLDIANNERESALASKIDIEVLSATGGQIVLDQLEPLRVRLRNRADTDLYVSVVMLDEYLGIEQIYPTTTTSVVLGAGRDVTLAVSVRPAARPDAPTRLTFKAFASARPADMAQVTQARLELPFDLSNIVRQPGVRSSAVPTPTSPRKTAKKARKKPSWVPGGPVAVIAKTWPNGKPLSIRFLGGTVALHRRVLAVASEWLQETGLSFRPVQTEPAAIRVGFDQSDGSWSHIGTDSLEVPRNMPTINLPVSMRTSTKEFRRFVLHEFGHALGLGAAQMSPLSAIPWRRQATYDYFARIAGWTREDVNVNIFDKYKPEVVIVGNVDARSIMYHPIPKECTEGGVTIVETSDLSNEDRRFISQLYPRQTDSAARPFARLVGAPRRARRAKRKRPKQK